MQKMIIYWRYKKLVKDYYSYSGITTNSLQDFFILIFNHPILGKSSRVKLFLNSFFELNPKIINFLDFGTGNGEMPIFLSKLGFKGFFEEIDTVKVERILNYTQYLGLNLKPIQSKVSAQKFDLILLLSVIDYLKDPFETLDFLCSKARKKGFFVISYPNKKRCLTDDWHKKINQLYVKSGFNEEDINSYFLNRGFERVAFKTYLPLNLYSKYYCLTENYKSNLSLGFLYVIFHFLSGLLSLILPKGSGTETFAIYRKH
jgi:SAM-dependent methyltransferase